MNIAMIAEMAAEAGSGRYALGDADGGITYEQLWDSSRRAAGWLNRDPRQNVVMIGVNSPLFPVALFGAALADQSFTPLNYRWTDTELLAAVHRLGSAVVVADDIMLPRLTDLATERAVKIVGRTQFLTEVDTIEPAAITGVPPQRPAVQLFTSGTSGTPKVAVLEHANLAAYIFGTVELMAAEEGDTQLISLPPYHVGGIANLLSTLYSGRRIVQLDAFDPAGWIKAARQHGVTHASVVPTMVARIVALLAQDTAGGLPSLRHLSYGGGRMPLPVLEEAMRQLPHVGFVNGYGLTETSSTITVLGPDEHRAAASSNDPGVRARLGSVGRALPTVELSVRDTAGQPVPKGELGELWVRGDQVSGKYVGVESGRNDDGWFPTKDGARIDSDGYVFIEGRLDDVIVRGGENISPGEVEDAIVSHPDVIDAGVIGLPDDDWGERIAAAVVAAPGRTPDPAELQEWVRVRLRSSKAPSTVQVVEALPYNDNGKLVRRMLREQLAARAES
ncbi:class I adenylate-forming enzyme family protein [Mycobacterium sp. URHB0044]|jgi:acyl-CoA synthetase (AMP-forming)/AMP-acid ligase II|uniref:class I adenylate-forming enzyme family protein n=1 Tax=Mycobacterium sp. URHB0044 TaxID=1380386 RepID=UPI000560910B|nr:AMP-binding protein [Mycobacterium sp. URHB0044]